jgi:hypothetical protein
MIQKIDAKELYTFQTELWERNLDKYSNKQNLDFKKHAFYLAKYDDAAPTPENIGLVLVRLALSDLEDKLSTRKKYVILQTYYDEGDLSTIDVVRLPFRYHREIVKEYLENILTVEISRQAVPLHESLSRFLTAGGFVEENGDKIKFHGSSGDFSNRFSVYDVNHIASYLTRESGLFENVKPENISKGEEYVERCLDIMRQHKLKPEFYSELVKLYLLENVREEKYVGSHLLYSLNLMKSIDRASKEGEDITQVLVEESVEGIGREMMIRGIAERLKKQKI